MRRLLVRVATDVVDAIVVNVAVVPTQRAKPASLIRCCGSYQGHNTSYSSLFVRSGPLSSVAKKKERKSE